MRFLENVKKGYNALLSGLSVSLKQTTLAYCDLETADSPTVFVAHDGSLMTLLRIQGVKGLVGREEFGYIQKGLQQSLQSIMSQTGYSIQVFFSHDLAASKEQITEIFRPARETSQTLALDLADLFSERIDFLSNYCAHEEAYVALWTNTTALQREALNAAQKNKQKTIKFLSLPAFTQTQNIFSAIPELRETHESFVRSVNGDLNQWGVLSEIVEVHDAARVMRMQADPAFTDLAWSPSLPGDKITIRELKETKGDISDITWPALAKQLLPRDAENLSLRTARVGDYVYGTVFVDLFPKEVQSFMQLLARTLQSTIPWRITFLIESNALGYANLRSAVASVLTVTSSQNRLISDALKLMSYINLNTDDAVVRLRVAAATWAPIGKRNLLRSRVSMLAKAVEGWGSCDVSQVCGDAYEGLVSTLLGISRNSVASPSIAPLSDVLRMLPFFRPASPWKKGAILFRSPDGKLWPYHPGSSKQNTWIDLFYARPGSGKSVLSNALNLAVCLSPGLQRLPRIAIIDVGPSSSGLISLLKEALPASKKHLVAYHRLRMHSDYAINPLDTQLGSRYPTPQERAFLVNFLVLLVTPVGAEKAYDGVSDMSGLIIDELYKLFSDKGTPNSYTKSVNATIDALLASTGFVSDSATTWWEVTDALFISGFEHEAMLAQRYAMPVLSDIAAICRMPAIVDLYGKITVPTGETLIHTFARMISASVREYPIISQITQFDLGESRVVSLDLDEVARSGGDAANRQTAVMYMLARYVLARHYYLTEDSVQDMPEAYQNFHKKRIREIREDPKRIVFDEFHRTAHAPAVRNQVLLDMREGRKWKVQIALLSQSLEDFDSVMVEFATSVFIMEAGPEQSIRKTAKVFGLSETARHALRAKVHGPREEGATFLAQFATKEGVNTQLLTATLGPIELWAFNTTAEDVALRNRLYQHLSPKQARSILAKRFPTGSAAKYIEELLLNTKENAGFIDDKEKESVMATLVAELLAEARNSVSR